MLRCDPAQGVEGRTVTRRTVLIIPASAYVLPVIRRAQALGLAVVATDRNPGAPGLHAADHAEIVDIFDMERMLAVARRYDVEAVVTEQTDAAVPTAAWVAEQLGLPSIGYEVACTATNKWRMREACRHAGIPLPVYRKVSSAPEAVDAAREIGLPVVLKPVDAQASRGVGRAVRGPDSGAARPVTPPRLTGRQERCTLPVYIKEVG